MTRLARTVATVLACIALSTPAALGWGRDGHRVVCEIAWRESSTATRVAVTEILRDDPATSFAASCDWADDVKYDDSHEWSRPWHYMDTSGTDGPEIASDCGGDGCAVSAIVHLVGALRGGVLDPRLGRAGSLKMLGHLVGDLHQPLHAGNADDLGGNTIDLLYERRPTTLHRLWDTHILSAADESWRETADRLGRSLPADATDVLDPMVWAEESYELAREHAYAVEDGARLDQAWVLARLPVVENRLALAGVRLAVLLDRTIGQDPATPGPPPFWVTSRRGTTYHYPECAGARSIVVRNLVIYRRPPAERTLHRGCPR